MTEGDALLQAIRDAPEDDGPRLVYADWLEEHGDLSRAEFIHIQCGLACPRVPGRRRERLRAREQELLAVHREEWLGKLRTSPLPWVFHRGFVERLGDGGVFHAGPFHYKDEHLCQYIRFFPDGRLLYGCLDPIPRSLLEVQRRLQRGKRDVLAGQYTLELTARSVAFRFQVRDGEEVVKCKGTIQGTCLRLWRAYGFDGQYRWVTIRRRLDAGASSARPRGRA
jgi:uncharacterized protein (TIGR02996 family)